MPMFLALATQQMVVSFVEMEFFFNQLVKFVWTGDG